MLRVCHVYCFRSYVKLARAGELSICRYCHELINSKKKRIKFTQLCTSPKVHQFIQDYQYAADLRREIDKQLAEYLERTHTLESSLLDNYELLDDTETQSISFSEAVRHEVLVVYGYNTTHCFKSKQLYDRIAAMFQEYQRCVTNILSTPCSTEKEKKILHNLKVIFLSSQAYAILSQKNILQMISNQRHSDKS